MNLFSMPAIVAIIVILALVHESSAASLGSVCKAVKTGNRLLDTSIEGYVEHKIWNVSLTLLRNSLDRNCYKNGTRYGVDSSGDSESEALTKALDIDSVYRCMMTTRKLSVIVTIGPCYARWNMFESWNDRQTTENVYFTSDFNALRVDLIERYGYDKEQVALAFPCREDCDENIKLQFKHIIDAKVNACRNLPTRKQGEAEKICTVFDNTKISKSDFNSNFY